jgi:hypothetical protein
MVTANAITHRPDGASKLISLDALPVNLAFAQLATSWAAWEGPGRAQRAARRVG